jgi:DNA-binding NarL/FixJ family response regulator
MRVLLIDDHVEVLDSVAAMLEAVPGIDVVGKAENGREGLRLTEELKPDFVITDFSMPGMDGIAVIRTLNSKPGAPKVVMMSFHSEPEYRDMALAVGAVGFLTKSNLYKELVPFLTRLSKEAERLN